MHNIHTHTHCSLYYVVVFPTILQVEREEEKELSVFVQMNVNVINRWNAIYTVTREQKQYLCNVRTHLCCSDKVGLSEREKKIGSFTLYLTYF